MKPVQRIFLAITIGLVLSTFFSAWASEAFCRESENFVCGLNEIVIGLAFFAIFSSIAYLLIKFDD